MAERYEKIARLLLRIHSKEPFKAEESRLLAQWILESEHNKKLFEELNDNVDLSVHWEDILDEKEDESWVSICKAIDGKVISPIIKTPLVSKSWNRQIAAIIGLGLLICISLWALAKYRTSKMIVSKELTENIPIIPRGLKKTILTLGDGSLVDPDTIQFDRPYGPGVIPRKSRQNIIDYSLGVDPSRDQGYFNRITTSSGKQISLVLSDGTRVWLNGSSSLRYPVQFSGIQRKVELRGEAYFQTSPDAKRPFTITFPDSVRRSISISVLGTDFNVRAYSQEQDLNATLISGSIVFSDHGRNMQLHPGQQAIVHGNSEVKFRKVKDLSSISSWKDGYFTFTLTTIDTVLAQMGLWFDINFDLIGCKQCLWVTMVIDNRTTLESFLQILERMDLRIKRNGNSISVTEQKYP